VTGPADLDLPAAPSWDLAEFGPRYAAAEQMARRYAAAVALVAGHPARDQLAAAWPTVRIVLEAVGRSCLTAIRQPPRSTRRRGLTRRQRPARRSRHLHQVHLALVALAQAVDAAVATAVSVVLAAEAPEAGRRAEADDWLTALGAAVAQLELTVAMLTDDGGAASAGDR